ncbi:hypothetical protein N7478_000528, partial [Penicillium angulare]|uniref:uncharacterized protein n=1 Tax=Penicillium angulare TaxID=116970 RepID=UPI002540401C
SFPKKSLANLRSLGALNNTSRATSWAAENPILATSVGIGTAGIVVMTAPGLVTAPMLSGLGFTAGGIQAGMRCITGEERTKMGTAPQSLFTNEAFVNYILFILGSTAAAIHSGIENIAAGSSAGAGGSGLAIVNGVVQAGGATMTLGSGGLAWAKARL